VAARRCASTVIDVEIVYTFKNCSNANGGVQLSIST
jgi:hypothetical protein